MVLYQKSINALNLNGQYLLDKDIPITIVLFITILQNFRKTKTYHALSRWIHEIQNE